MESVKTSLGSIAGTALAAFMVLVEGLVFIVCAIPAIVILLPYAFVRKLVLPSGHARV